MAAVAAIGILSIVMLVASVFLDIYIGFTLTAVLAMFALLAWRRGIEPREIARIAWEGAKKSVPPIKILLVIGAMTALWMASGTVGALVYYGTQVINPGLFILFVFILSTLGSFLLGTSFGTASTIGVVMMVLARGGGVDPCLTGGAVMAGIYIGDRASPMSSSLNLLSNLTGVDHYQDVKMMIKSSVIPILLSALGFFFLSGANPLNIASSTLPDDLKSTFQIGFWAILPAIVVLALCVFKVKVTLAMLGGIVSAAVVAVAVQGAEPLLLLKSAVVGFSLEPDSPLAAIIQGGGLYAMAKTCFIVFAACALAGIVQNGGLLGNSIDAFLEGGKGRFGIFSRTFAIAVLTSAWGCSQVLSIVMTTELMQPSYEKAGWAKRDLARDVSFTSMLLCIFIPWNMAFMVPTATLGLTGVGHMAYFFFPIIAPLYQAVCCMLHDMRPAGRGEPACQAAKTK